jgi:glycosyltransferase involved in cell wall biosynthesis
MRSKRPDVSIIIPTLNEKRNITEVLRSVKHVLKDYSYEIIVVDKHSPDGTDLIAKRHGAKVLYDDMGKGSALIKGMKSAKGKVIVSMDADLSNNPSELKILISGIQIGYDVCMGSRFLTGGGSEDMPAFRRFGNKVFVSLVNLIYGSRYTDMCYGYRSFSRKAVRKLNLREKGFGIETEINIKTRKAGLKAMEVPSYEKKRSSGEGKLRSFSDGYRILRTIFRNVFS